MVAKYISERFNMRLNNNIKRGDFIMNKGKTFILIVLMLFSASVFAENKKQELDLKATVILPELEFDLSNAYKNGGNGNQIIECRQGLSPLAQLTQTVGDSILKPVLNNKFAMHSLDVEKDMFINQNETRRDMQIAEYGFMSDINPYLAMMGMGGGMYGMTGMTGMYGMPGMTPYGNNNSSYGDSIQETFGDWT
jgi:hypothetical protein